MITRHTGVSRHFPCPIKHRVQIPCEICLVLLRISTQIVKKRSAHNEYHVDLKFCIIEYRVIVIIQFIYTHYLAF